MSRKSLLIILLAVVSIFLILIVSYGFNNNIAKSSENSPQNNPPESPEEPLFVIPENPVGTLGMISALAAAFVIFASIKKKRK